MKLSQEDLVILAKEKIRHRFLWVKYLSQAKTALITIIYRSRQILMKIKFEDLILFENQDYIVINKPAYVATLDERQADNSQSILRMAKAYSSDAQMGHRLDKETSGILAIAKNPEAYRHLSMQFEHRQVAKRYHAVVNGTHDF